MSSVRNKLWIFTLYLRARVHLLFSHWRIWDILPCILLEYSCFYFIIKFDLHIVCSSWCKDTRPMNSLIQHHRKPGIPEAFLLLQVHSPPSIFYYLAGMCSGFYLGNYPDWPYTQWTPCDSLRPFWETRPYAAIKPQQSPQGSVIPVVYFLNNTEMLLCFLKHLDSA